MKNILALLAFAFLSACAQSAHEIPAAYVSPSMYEDSTCKKITAELQTVSARESILRNEVNNQASTDQVQTAVGVVLFWPALLFLDGDTPESAEYARLKGEKEALEKASLQKNC